MKESNRNFEMEGKDHLDEGKNPNPEKETEILNNGNSSVEVSKNGIPLVLNKEGERVESLQFKALIELIGDQEKAEQIYGEIKKLEKADFSGSKLRDKNGELMIVWHGSSRKFDKFNPEARGEFRWRNQGIHFQSSKEVVAQYTEKARRAWDQIVYDIGIEHFGLEYGVTINDEQEVEAKKIFNEIIEDLIRNGEDSSFYEKRFEKNIRTPDRDVIVYGSRKFSTEWALEIFGGEMPSKDNCSTNEKYGTYFGNDIGEYKYAAVLDIEKPFSKETREIDYSYELGEKSHREQGTDGTILTHSENLIGMGQEEIYGTKGTYSVAVFEADRIKIIGIETEEGFEIRI